MDKRYTRIILRIILKIMMVIIIVYLSLTFVVSFVHDKYVCHSEEYILLEQYISKSDHCSNNCLMMDVIDIHTHKLFEFNNFSRYKNISNTFYFAEENKIRTDLDNDERINVTWCPTIHGERIRNVK